MAQLPNDGTIDRMESLLNIASDSTRLKILYSISEGEKNVSEIVDEVGASQSLVSHQLMILREANLVSTRKEGTKVFYSLADDHVIALLKVVYDHVTEKK
ncbi:MAG: HTH-type transcriptional repressor CzrA [Tenericutes bacterium ADurb.BinA155]|jgi:DNA-binding transcriptional ArsR family regulator|nr:MAG: HTH-type transcriptional repressor CzrA [Tenericutes bacterium ADurb.BinA155]